MESINVKIDDAITKIEMVDDGEKPSTKEPTIKVETLDIEVEGPTLEEDSKGDMPTRLCLSRMMKITSLWLKYMLMT